MSTVNYRHRVAMCINDTRRSGRTAFIIYVYGLSVKDTLSILAEGSPPFLSAIARMGLNPENYIATWDVRL